MLQWDNKSRLQTKHAPQRFQPTLTRLPSKPSPSNFGRRVLLLESRKALFRFWAIFKGGEGAQLKEKFKWMKRHEIWDAQNGDVRLQSQNVTSPVWYEEDVHKLKIIVQLDSTACHQWSLLSMNSLSFRSSLYSGQVRPHVNVAICIRSQDAPYSSPFLRRLPRNVVFSPS